MIKGWTNVSECMPEDFDCVLTKLQNGIEYVIVRDGEFFNKNNIRLEKPLVLKWIKYEDFFKTEPYIDSVHIRSIHIHEGGRNLLTAKGNLNLRFLEDEDCLKMALHFKYCLNYLNFNVFNKLMELRINILETPLYFRNHEAVRRFNLTYDLTRDITLRIKMALNKDFYLR